MHFTIVIIKSRADEINIKQKNLSVMKAQFLTLINIKQNDQLCEN